MREFFNTSAKAKLEAVNTGIKMAKKFDPDIAKDMVIEILKKNPEIEDSLPKNVTGILVDTNTSEPIKVSRDELVNTDIEEKIVENAVDWTWDQVFANMYNQI